MGIAAIAAGIGAAGAVGSSLIGASASSNAADAQVQAADQASATQLGMYNQTRSDLMPWQAQGQAASSQLASLYGLNPGGAPGISAAATQALQNTPGYQFTYNQGLQALDRSAASRGTLLSGGQLKDAQTYGQGVATSNAWAPYVSELNNISQMGQTSAAKVGDLATQTGQGIGSAQLAAGSAASQGISQSALGYASALQSGASQLGSFVQNQWGGGGIPAGNQWGGAGYAGIAGMTPVSSGDPYAITDMLPP